MPFDNELTLPGDIPGLLRRGSPVSWQDYSGVDAVVVAIGDGPALVVAEEGGSVVVDEDVLQETLELDLTDATGRAHASWWISENGPDKWCMVPGRRPGAYAHIEQDGVHGWFFVGDHGGFHFKAWRPDKEQGWKWLDLDPNDQRLLSDGSRWVDAEAIRLVVLYLAGRSNDE